MGIRQHLDDLVRYRHAYALAASAALGSIFYGWDVGLIGGVLSMKSFQDYFGLDKMETAARTNLEGNIVAILQGGCFFGALSTSWLASRFGRKPSLLAAGVIYIIGSAIQSIVGLGSSEKTGLDVLYFSRFLGGWGVGMVSALVPTYVSECAPKAIRGRCTGAIQFANNIGIMLSYWVNYSASKDIAYGEMQWRIPFIMQIIPGVLFVIAMLIQPESPRWLAEHEKLDRAARALAFSSGKTKDDESVQETLREILKEFEGRERVSIWQQLTLMGESRSIAYRCFVASLVMFFQQWTGTNAINYYSPRIFASLGVSGQNAGLFATGIYGVVKVIAVGTTLAIAVESFGRKKCLILGGLIQALTMLWIAGYSSLHKGTGVDGASYVSIVAVYIYAIGYCIGWGPVPWVVASEVVPNHVRTAAMSVAVGVNWLFSFTISKITPILLADIGYGTFLVFGCACVLMVLWAYLALPETAGVALEDVRFLFEDALVVRSLLDAPGGRLFVHGRGTVPVRTVAELRREADEREARGGADGSDSASDVKKADVEQEEDVARRPVESV